jgi:glycosyltransferase involved in cell wall biosynthesis
MKAFEYMACGATIIAADTPAVREIVSPANAFLYRPDDAESLAEAVRTVFADSNEADRRNAAALAASNQYSWRGRAERILAFINSRIWKRA